MKYYILSLKDRVKFECKYIEKYYWDSTTVSIDYICRCEDSPYEEER